MSRIIGDALRRMSSFGRRPNFDRNPLVVTDEPRCRRSNRSAARYRRPLGIFLGLDLHADLHTEFVLRITPIAAE
jgi:hypothetical protein